MNLPLWLNRNKERPRFYLFAGMGGTAARKKHRRILAWSLVAGVVASALFAALLLFLNRPDK
jgi:hypothetical protein